jgi:hypothetical protein
MRRLAAATLLLVAACRDEGGDGPPADTEASETSTSTTNDLTSSGSLGSEESGSGPSSSSSTSEGSTGEIVECDASSRCLAGPPAGWLGPVARFRGPMGMEPPECAGGYPEVGLALRQGFIDAQPAQCDCTCEVSVSSVCSVVMYPDVTSTVCNDFSVFIMNGAECTTYDIPSGSLYGSMSPIGTPQCVSTEDEQIPGLEWQADVHSCTQEEIQGPCDEDGSVCAPAAPDGFESGLCIFTQGESECPDGPFSDRTVLFSSVDDRRGCSECECGAPPAVNCEGVFDMYDSTDCSGTLVASGPNNGCSGAVANVGSIHVNLPGDPQCGVDGPSEPEGTAEPVGLFTYCCE